MTADARLYRRGCGAALVAGPALFFLAADPATVETALHDVQESGWALRADDRLFAPGRA